ncbi:30S ribosomal protein S6 [Pelovirga terrestris]|uniref:Small ribosomal subunit protein bS6 n=1 Tax=Pelovirga terrestris TaxID=2771352 RepID=A0A8J6QWR8_9BACT|nr:30S ribosomal protein S6 [Pelovirga terrestris]MBD1400113.1 30S ribosomal protein S6 [Pelovirga terrestris]
MRNYESLYIVHPEVVGDELTAMVDKFQKILNDQQAEIVKIDNWGVRKLAYPIKKVERGNYVQVLFSAGPEVVAEYERRLRLDEQILRFLTVRLDRDFTAEVAEPAAQVRADDDDDDFNEDDEE